MNHSKAERMKHRSSTEHNEAGRTRWRSWMQLVCLIGVTVCLAACQSSNPQSGSPVAGVEEEVFSTNTLRLQEGDVIRVSFENATNLNTAQTILLDGMINMPIIGQTKAAGKTIAELEAMLNVLYEPQIRSPDITVARLSTSASYSIGGAVLKPGKMPLDRPLTVLEAIMEAGGVNNARAKLDKVVVLRIENGRRVRHVFNLKRALGGKEPSLFYLKPSDIIYVPEKTFNF